MSQSLDQLVRGMEQNLQAIGAKRFSAEEKALSELENQLADLNHDQQKLKTADRKCGRARVRGPDSFCAIAPIRCRDDCFPMLQKLRRLLEDVDVDPLGPLGQRQVGKSSATARRRAAHAGTRRRRRSQSDGAGSRTVAQAHRGRVSSRGTSGALGTKAATCEVTQQSRAGQKHRARNGQRAGSRPALPEDLMNPTERRQLGELRAGQNSSASEPRTFSKTCKRRATPKMRPSSSGSARDANGVVKKRAGLWSKPKASSKLQPRSASSSQGQAMDQLSQLRKEMQMRDAHRRWHGHTIRARSSGADEYRPKEFRQDILDAGREPPTEYRDQVRRYYEADPVTVRACLKTLVSRWRR